MWGKNKRKKHCNLHNNVERAKVWINDNKKNKNGKNDERKAENVICVGAEWQKGMHSEVFCCTLPCIPFSREKNYLGMSAGKC